MVATFDRFLNQLNATGREYGDGFDMGHFRGLTEDEKKKVFEMLAAKHDTVAISGLALLAGESAIPYLEKQLENPALNEYGTVTVYGELWKLTSKHEYQRGLFQSLRNDDENIRSAAMRYLEEKSSFTKEFAQVMKEKILVDPSALISAWAARLLVRNHRARSTKTMSDQEFKKIIRELYDENSLSTRKQGLSYLEANYPVDFENDKDNNYRSSIPVINVTSGATQGGRALANQTCPKAGFWYTPAKQGSRRFFNVGEAMPDFPDSKYGETIWYWDQQQN